jgi:hypothetical protein
MALKQCFGWLYGTILEDKGMAVMSQTKMLHKFRHHTIQHELNVYSINSHILLLYYNNAM